MNTPKTTWKTENEYQDGTGDDYYYCICPQNFNPNSPFPEHLWRLHYFPRDKKLWFFDEVYHESPSIRMYCDSWDTAELIKSMLTNTESKWMKTL